MNSESLPRIDPHLRKAAVVLRSLDADTAAMMLGQLSMDEAAAVRAAMRSLGPVDSDEQAKVLAELGGGRTTTETMGIGDVELSLSSSFRGSSLADSTPIIGRPRRF